MPTAVRPLLALEPAVDLGAERISPILGFQLSSLRYARQSEMITDAQFAAHVAALMGSFVSRQALRADPANPKQALQQGSSSAEDGDGPAAICQRRSLSQGSSRAGSPAQSVTPRRTPRNSLSALGPLQRGSPSGTPRRTPRVRRLSAKLETPNPTRGGVVGGWFGAALRAPGPSPPRDPLLSPGQRSASARGRLEESSNALHGGTAARRGTSPRRASEDAVNRRESGVRTTGSAEMATRHSVRTMSSGCAMC